MAVATFKKPGKRARAGGGRGRPGGGFTGRRAELVVLGAALIVRLIHWAGMLGDPLGDVPRMDPLYHDAWARAIAGGDLTFEGPFFRAPLYGYFLGFLYAISGGSIAFARLVQLLLGLVTAFLVMRIGKRTLGERVGLVAGGLWGIYPIALRYEGDLLLDGLFVLLVMGGLLQYLRCRDGGSRWGWLAAGALFGLAAITRPNILAFVGVLPLVEWVARRYPGRPPGAPATWRAVARAGAAFVLGLVIPIAPVTAHNVIVGHDLVPIASQGGVNFYIGNNPRSDGFTAIVPGTRATWWGGHDDAVELAEEASGRKLRPSEVSDYWLDAGIKFMREEPAGAARLTLRKLYLFWWGAEISNNEHIYFLRRYSLPMRVGLWHAGVFFPFGVLAPLAVVGMGLAMWRGGWAGGDRRPALGVMVLAAFVVVYMATVVMFFVCARFRLPVIPVLLLFGVFAGGELWRRRRVSALAVLAVLVVLFNLDPYRLSSAVFGSEALSYLDLGGFYAEKRDFDAAEEMLRKSAELDPGHPGPHAWLGWIALERGDLERAEAELRLATRGDPVLFRDVVAQAERDLGRLAMRRGWYDRALAVYRASLSLNPESAVAHAGAGTAAAALGDTAAAAAHFRHALVLDPENAVARNGLATLR